MKYIKKLTDYFINENNSWDESLRKRIIDFVENTNTYLVLYDASDEDMIMYNTRENGSVGEEEASQIDVDEAKRVLDLLKKEFSSEEIIMNIEIVDEWVHLNITPKKGIEYKYNFIKDLDGAGFSSSFDTMDELIEKYGDWVDVDWETIKDKVEQIDDYPRNKFTGWYDSYRQMIMSKDNPSNEWGYNFYISKSRKNPND